MHTTLKASRSTDGWMWASRIILWRGRTISQSLKHSSRLTTTYTSTRVMVEGEEEEEGERGKGKS